MSEFTQQELLDYCLRNLHYNPFTGQVWRAKTNYYYLCDCEDVLGYIGIKINYVRYYAHRLIWLMVYGEMVDEIDHINTIKSDNRLANLRQSTHSQNHGNKGMCSNNTSGYKGACLHHDGRKRPWQATIKCEGKAYAIGHFMTAREAAEAYNKKAIELFGKFARLNVI